MGFKFKVMPSKFLVNFSDLSKEDLIVDVRTKEEHTLGSVTDINIPILKQEDRGFYLRHTWLVIPVIVNGLWKNRKEVCDSIDNVVITNNIKYIVIACSKGRLRSPITWWYLRFKYKDIKFKVLKGGIKGVVN